MIRFTVLLESEEAAKRFLDLNEHRFTIKRQSMGRPSKEKDAAKKFLLRQLRRGRKNPLEIFEAAEREGIMRKTLYRAKQELPLVSRKVPEHGHWAWYWWLTRD